MTTFRQYGQRLSNWGRWGADDERGTLNLVTADRVAAAGRLIRAGKTFALGIPLDATGPGVAGGRPNPMHMMTQTASAMGAGVFFADDYLMMHTHAATQWDALCHVFYDGRLYNDFPADELSATGAGRLGIQTMATDVVGRGVLLDLAADAPGGWLPAGHEITPDDLDSAERVQGVTVAAGDILCVRTGWRRKFLAGEIADWYHGEPGLALECCDWLHDRDVAAVCCDNYGVEVLPSSDPETVAPLHGVLLRDMGMPLGEMFDFEVLAADCHADGVWEFFLSAPALQITGGVGSPLNPLAFK